MTMEPAGSDPEAPVTTVDAALAAARSAGIERQDAQRLLAAVVGQPRTWLLAHGEALLAPAQTRRWQDGLRRAQAGEPLAYLLGSHEFYGLGLRITSDVLVPRADTETLVDWALDCLRAWSASNPGSPRVLDLGTGSGAIALALKHSRPDATVWAVDASAEALAVARGNGQALGLTVQWCQGDWWSAVDSRPFDLVLSNPPYIAEGDPHLADLAHEPALALSSGPDGLDALRQIIAGARSRMCPGAWLLLEHGHDQAAAVADLLVEAGFQGVQSRADLAGHLRCTGGSACPAPSGPAPGGALPRVTRKRRRIAV